MHVCWSPPEETRSSRLWSRSQNRRGGRILADRRDLGGARKIRRCDRKAQTGLSAQRSQREPRESPLARLLHDNGHTAEAVVQLTLVCRRSDHSGNAVALARMFTDNDDAIQWLQRALTSPRAKTKVAWPRSPGFVAALETPRPASSCSLVQDHQSPVRCRHERPLHRRQARQERRSGGPCRDSDSDR